jgi:hypothetical protein
MSGRQWSKYRQPCLARPGMAETPFCVLFLFLSGTIGNNFENILLLKMTGHEISVAK